MTLISAIYIGLAFMTLVLHLVGSGRPEPHQKYIVLHMVLILCSGAVAVGIIELTTLGNNLFVYHIFNPAEYLVLCMLYLQVFTNPKIKNAIRGSMPLVVLLSLVFAIFIQPPNVNNTFIIMLESVLIVMWSLLFLRETLMLQNESRLQQFPMFWVSIGLLFYFIGNLCVETLLNYLLDQSVELTRRAYKVSFIFKYVLFVLLMISAFSRTIFRSTDPYHE